ncbi:acetate--CoA ligase family protein [Oceanibium sediminis]|uniref:acetate--CoA ligase family protein n=1 Tax=Oceanibium sediminis TaxID=2026339 RepID=UPI000DD4A9B0|nr:acetate--CoA ligase family protein [Oceanibium sediminis]
MNCAHDVKDSGSQSESLESLLSPRRIAVVGVSAADPQSWGHRVVRVLIDGGFDGDVHVVHPKTDFPGVPTVRAIADIPNPELVVICVPAERAIGVVSEARSAGAKAVIVFASEFAEAGAEGAALQDRLVEAAGGMAMLGPNCFGISNRVDDVKLSAAPFLNHTLRGPGEVALVAQSGALGLVLSRCVEEAGSGYSYFVSVGNEATLGATEIARHLVERDEVNVVLLYIEALRDPRNLAETATRAAALGKRVVLLNAGRSEAGQRAALSHTAAIVGNDMFLQSLCDDFGIVRIHDDDEVKPVLAALERDWQMPVNPRVCILSNSGGAGAVLADQVEAAGGRVVALADETRRKVAEIGMIGAGDTNPIDIGGGWEATLDLFKPTLDTLIAADEVDALIVYIAFGEMCADQVVPIAQYCSDSNKPVTFIWQIAPAAGLAQVETPGILATSMGEGVRMLGAQMKLSAPRSATWRDLAQTNLVLPDLVGGQKTLAEYESSQLLGQHGMRFVPCEFGKVDALEDLTARVATQGWDLLVVKGNAHDVPHRNRVGLVRVGVTPAELPGTLAEMAKTLNDHSKDPARGLLVQPMVSFDAEIGVGALRDPLYGPVVVIGPGGVGIEEASGARDALLLNTDSANWDAYAARVEARHGLAPGALRPVIEGIAFVMGSDDIAEIDVNPMVRGEEGGLVALDSLIVVNRN